MADARRWNRGLVRLIPWVLVLSGAAAYSNTLAVPFHFDDRFHIVENPALRQLWPVSGVLGGTNRPVVNLSLALNHAWGGYDVASYHAVNLAIHLLAGLALYGILRRTLLGPRLTGRFGPAAPWLAFAVALLWLLHPLQTQAVTYVIQRAESLMGLFYLSTLYCAIRSATSAAPVGWGIAAVVACSLGMGSKEVMVTAPLLVLAYDRVFLAGSWSGALGARPALYAGLAASGMVLVVSFGAGLDATGETLSPLQYLLAQPAVLLHYLRLVVWPDPLVFDHHWTPTPGLATWAPLLGVTAGVLATGWLLWRGSPLGFAGAWFFGILAPTSSVMPIQDLAVEHRVYLSLAAPLTLAVLAGFRLLERARGGRLAAALLLVLVAGALGTLTHARNRDYRSAAALWQTVVAARSDNDRAHYNLAVALRQAGDLDAAWVHNRIALELNPRSHGAHVNRGALLAGEGRYAEAIEHFERALKLRPDLVEAHLDLALAFDATDAAGPAAASYQRVLELEPGHEAARRGLARALHRSGRARESLPYYRSALERDPDSVPAQLAFAAALVDAGEPGAAVAWYRTALRLDPRSVAALNDLAWTLATSADPDVHEPARAVQLAERAAALTEHRNPTVLDTLGASYAAAGRFEDAARTARRALELAAESGRPADAAVQERIGLYEQRRAYVE